MADIVRQAQPGTGHQTKPGTHSTTPGNVEEFMKETYPGVVHRMVEGREKAIAEGRLRRPAHDPRTDSSQSGSDWEHVPKLQTRHPKEAPQLLSTMNPDDAARELEQMRIRDSEREAGKGKSKGQGKGKGPRGWNPKGYQGR